MRLSSFLVFVSGLLVSTEAAAIPQGINNVNNNQNNNNNNNNNNNVVGNVVGNVVSNVVSNIAPVSTVGPTLTVAAPGGTLLPTEVLPSFLPTEILPSLLPTNTAPPVPTTAVPTLLPTEVLPTLPTVAIPTLLPTEIISSTVPTTTSFFDPIPIVPTSFTPSFASTAIPVTDRIQTSTGPTTIPTTIPTATVQPVVDICSEPGFTFTFDQITVPVDHTQVQIPGTLTPKQCCRICQDDPTCAVWASLEQETCIIASHDESMALNTCPAGPQDVIFVTSMTALSFFGLGPCGGTASAANLQIETIA